MNQLASERSNSISETSSAKLASLSFHSNTRAGTSGRRITAGSGSSGTWYVRYGLGDARSHTPPYQVPNVPVNRAISSSSSSAASTRR
ncbi:MAG: hypothetical protein NT062_02695 [Proteobacteria bacterium]|nr:hypothetical protein [Pseudomonadota bacterium]